MSDSVRKWASESFGEAGELWAGNAVAELLEFAADRGVTGLSALAGGRRSLVVSGVLGIKFCRRVFVNGFSRQMFCTCYALHVTTL